MALVFFSCTLYAENTILLYLEHTTNVANLHHGGINNREKAPHRRSMLCIKNDSQDFVMESDVDKCQIVLVYLLTNDGQMLFSQDWNLADSLYVSDEILNAAGIIQIYMDNKLYQGYINF